MNHHFAQNAFQLLAGCQENLFAAKSHPQIKISLPIRSHSHDHHTPQSSFIEADLIHQLTVFASNSLTRVSVCGHIQWTGYMLYFGRKVCCFDFRTTPSPIMPLSLSIYWPHRPQNWSAFSMGREKSSFDREKQRWLAETLRKSKNFKGDIFISVSFKFEHQGLPSQR